MLGSKNAEKDFYSETEAAEALEISLSHLHELLDEHIFNDGTTRPQQLSFRTVDLVVLSFWLRATPDPKVLRKPRRDLPM